MAVSQAELDEMFAQALPHNEGGSRREFLCDNGVELVCRNDIQQRVKDMFMRKVVSTPRLNKQYNSNSDPDHDCTNHLFRRNVHRGWGGTMAVTKQVVNDHQTVCEMHQIQVAIYKLGDIKSTEKCWCGSGKPTQKCHNEHFCVRFTNMKGDWQPFCCDVMDGVHSPRNLLWSYDSIYGCARQPSKLHLCGAQCMLNPVVLQHRQEECVCPLTLQSLYANIDDGMTPLPSSAMGNAHIYTNTKQTAAQKRAQSFNLEISVQNNSRCVRPRIQNQSDLDTLVCGASRSQAAGLVPDLLVRTLYTPRSSAISLCLQLCARPPVSDAEENTSLCTQAGNPHQLVTATLYDLLFSPWAVTRTEQRLAEVEKSIFKTFASANTDVSLAEIRRQYIETIYKSGLGVNGFVCGVFPLKQALVILKTTADIIVEFITTHTTLHVKDISSELILAILSKVRDKKQNEIVYKGRSVFPPKQYKNQISILVSLLPPSSQFSSYIKKRYRDR